jgi:hypothetical protein
MAVTNADILGWLNENPNASPALINQTMAEAGVSAAQYQSATGAPPPPVAPTTVTELYQQELGRAPESKAVIKEWEKIFGDTIEPTEIAQFQQAAQLEKTAPTVANIKGQILAQGTTDQWSGQGFGSAEANATDMAKILAGIGITDINQFGQITKQVPVTSTDEYGNTYDTGQTQTVTTYGNKVTGQEVPNTYSERQTGNAFGGTFAGKGNTGYRVEIAPNGTPVFYTTGASSNDLFNILSENPVLNVGANVVAGVFGGPLAVGALQAAQGKDFKDVAKATVLSWLGQQAGQYFGANAPIDASNMNPAQFSDALETQLITEMQRSGLTNAQITQFLENASPADIASITSALPVTGASDTLLVEAARAPITADALINTLSQVPTVSVTAKTPEKEAPKIVDVTNALIAGATPPTVEIKDTRPIQREDAPAIPIITSPPATNPPIVQTPTVPTVTPPNKDTTLTVPDIIRIIGIGGTIAGIDAAATPSTSTGPQYPIVDVPADWRTPPKTGVAPFTPLPPINFGDRNLLIGTQWEKFLDPNYGQVPEPIQYSQPSSLSYNDLMGILGSKQGMPSASTLSINDIISGIQNQYGQARSSTMG